MVANCVCISSEGNTERWSAHGIRLLSYTTARTVQSSFLRLACATGGLWDWAPPFAPSDYLRRVTRYPAFLSAYNPRADRVTWNGPSLGLPRPVLAVSAPVFVDQRYAANDSCGDAWGWKTLMTRW